MALNPKQAAFVREYQKDRNATQAAIRAGYSEKTARSQGQRLLTYVDIAEAIDAAAAQHAERCDITVDSLTKELEADRGLARTSKQASAAITATMSIAKLHGLDIERSEVNLEVSKIVIEIVD